MVVTLVHSQIYWPRIKWWWRLWWWWWIYL